MNNYEDLINLPHKVSNVHKQMLISNRAAIFAPFAALTGFGESIFEVSRITDSRIELSEEDKSDINSELQYLNSIIKSRPLVTIKYFIPDERKSGGKYIEYKGNIKKIDDVYKYIVFTDNKKIKIVDIISIITML